MTTTPIDLSPFADPQMRTELENIERLLSQSRRLFLFGAGCSKVAGLPLTAELCDMVLEGIDDPTAKKLLESIREEYDGESQSTIED